MSWSPNALTWNWGNPLLNSLDCTLKMQGLGQSARAIIILINLGRPNPNLLDNLICNRSFFTSNELSIEELLIVGLLF